jgi:hypothetical protein
MALDARIVAATGAPPLTECPAIGRNLPATGGMRSQAGAFDPVTWRIDLAPDLDLTTPEGQGYLLHELVHHGQARSGRIGRGCVGLLEAEAYALQAHFLRERGQAKDARMIAALGALLGQCPSS